MPHREYFVPENGTVAFEECGKENGMYHWTATQLADLLGYESFSTFKDVINKAVGVCMTLNIPVQDNIIQVFEDGRLVDYKLSRFACMLVAMNGNPAMPQVAKAQAYFITLAEASHHILNAENTDRVSIRQELSKGEKSLHQTASLAGVENYAFFQNAGYRGMYNMNYKDLICYKGVSDGKRLLDYMGSTELAAN